MKKVTKSRKPSGKTLAALRAELHPEAVAFGQRIRGAWQLDEAAEGYLVQAVENLSVAMHAQELVRAEGIIFRCQTGYKLPHPAWKIAKEASALFMRAINYMGLDIEAVGDVGRPVGS